MKRPLLIFAISLMSGIITAYLSRSFVFAGIIAILGIILSLVLYFRSNIPKYILIGILVFYLAGSLETLIRTNISLDKFKSFNSKFVTVEGYIYSEPDIREKKINYTVKTLSIESEGKTKKIKGKILLTVLREEKGILYDYGSKVSIMGTLNLPTGQRNPGGFNYRDYLMKSGISASMFAVPANISVEKGKYSNLLVESGIKIRSSIVNVINKCLPPEQAGLLNGMLIGYRDGLSEEVQQAFSDAGLSHIMAASGMNIAFVIAPLIFLFKRIHLRPKAANPIMISTLVLFVYITGFSPSIVRAAIMAIIILVGQMLRRETDILTSMSFSAILLLIYNPGLLFDVGFQLSYAATLSLVLLYKNIKQLINFKFIPGFIRDMAAVTIAAQLGVMPITAFYFNKMSLISVFSNLLVLPLVQTVTIIGAAMALIGQASIVVAQLIGYFNCVLLSLMLLITKITSQIPLAAVRVVTPHLPVILAYYCLVIFFFYTKPLYKLKIKKRYYLGAASAVLIIISIYLMLPKNLEIICIDVGQGDAALVRTSSGKNILIDGGGSSSRLNPGMNTGESIIMPLLLDCGINKLDAVIASHGHNDHIQGLLYVLKEMKTYNLIIPDNKDKKEFESLTSIARERKIPIIECSRGDTIKLDSKTFLDVISPSTDMNSNADELGETSLNNTSLVLKLHYGETSFLFTGDIQKETEDILISDRTDLRADVLKVAHHGSKYSTQESFLEVVKPAAAVISVGKNNFGHPASQVVDRIEKDQIKLFRTDTDGAIIITSDGKRIRIRKMIP